MSMARSTPAQKPRGPARRISEMADLIALLVSMEIVRYSDHADMGFPPPVRPGRVAIGVVLEAVAGVDRGRVGAEDGREAGPERGLRVGVVLVEGLEAGFEGAVEGTTARGAERKDRDPQPQVEELEVTLVARALQIELRAVAALGREHVRALLERLLRVEGPRE